MIRAKKSVAMLNEISRGKIDSGSVYPKASKTTFIINPKNIEKEMLSPTDRTIFSTEPSLFSFRVVRMRKPGIKVRKMNAEISLSSGMLNRMERSVMMRKAVVNKRNLLELAVLSVLIITTCRAAYLACAKLSRISENFLAISR